MKNGLFSCVTLSQGQFLPVFYNAPQVFTSRTIIMTQDELKKAVGWAALQYVQPGTIVGVGTGSTAAHFIDALGTMKGQIEGAVSSSDASTEN